MTRLKVSAALATLYTLAAILTASHDTPATHTPTHTWETQ